MLVIYGLVQLPTKQIRFVFLWFYLIFQQYTKACRNRYNLLLTNVYHMRITFDSKEMMM